MASSGRCERCGVERWKRHRHHKVPKSRGGSEDSENIEFLCANCHDEHRPGTPNGTDTMTHTPQARARRSASLTRRWADPEKRERLMGSRAKQVRSNGATPEEIRERNERVIALRGEGWTQQAIADEFGIAQANVSLILRSAGHTNADARIAVFDARILALREEHPYKPQRELAELAGCSQARVSQALRRACADGRM
jgi:transcriptional regulator